jgi:glycosyltransferase involved in cell wall biosynthesis
VTESPQVAVVIPTRDRRELVRRAVGCALAQEGVAVEIVVVDDGSRDGTAASLAALGDERVRVIRHETSQGVARARNAGARAAGGAWIAFLDDDDLWAPGKLRAQLDAAERAGAGWAWSAAVEVDAELRPLLVHPAPSPDGLALRLLREQPVATPSAVVVRAELLARAGGFDPSFAALADWDLWLRLAALAPGAASPGADVGYVAHGGNMLAGSGSAEVLRPEFERLAAKHIGAAAAAGVTFGEPWWSRWRASRARLAGRRLEAARLYLGGALQARSGQDALRAATVLAGGRAWRWASRRRRGVAAAPPWLTTLGAA